MWNFSKVLLVCDVYSLFFLGCLDGLLNGFGSKKTLIEDFAYGDVEICNCFSFQFGGGGGGVKPQKL